MNLDEAIMKLKSAMNALRIPADLALDALSLMTHEALFLVAKRKDGLPMSREQWIELARVNAEASMTWVYDANAKKSKDLS